MKKSIFLLTLVLSIGLSFAACSKTEPETITPDPNPDTEDTTSVPETPKSRAVEVLNLTPDFIAVSGIEKDGEYETGSEVTLTIAPGTNLSSGFSTVHMEHIHIHVNDRVYIPAFPSSDEEYIQSITLSVQIPEDDFEVVACYSGQQQMTEGGYTMYLEDNEYVRLYGVSHEEQYKYFDCYLLTVDAYTITDVQFKVGDGEWRNVSDVEGCSFSRSEVVENVYSVAIRPDYQNVTGDVTLRVEGEQHGRYTITWENADETYLDMEKSVLPSESIDGETVTAELWVHDEYYLNTAEASVPGLELNVISRAYVQFVMPASDVIVTLDILEKIPVYYTESEHVTEAQFYDADDIYYGIPTSIGIPGEAVYLFAAAEEGYKPMTAVLSTGESFEFEYYGPDRYQYMASVIIPQEAESMSASIVAARAYTAEATDGVDIMFNGGHLYAEGETVSMSIYVPEGQRIEDVVVTDALNNDIPVTMDLPYASFIMPASDVTVSVIYEDVNADEEVSVIAYYDSDIYDVSSSTNWDWDFTEGFTVAKGSTFYLSVYNYEYTMYYVGVQVGDNVTIYPAEFDDMMGEYSFGKAIVADGDVIIKVGATEEEVSF